MNIMVVFNSACCHAVLFSENQYFIITLYLTTNIYLVCVTETEIVYLMVDANQNIIIIVTLPKNLCLEIRLLMIFLTQNYNLAGIIRRNIDIKFIKLYVSINKTQYLQIFNLKRSTPTKMVEY